MVWTLTEGEFYIVQSQSKMHELWRGVWITEFNTEILTDSLK